MMITFLDMDGVLVDFRKGAANLHGMDVEEITNEMDYDFWRAWGMSDEDFWHPLSNVDAWRYLPKLPWADELYTTCASLGKVFFSTAPNQSPYSSAGKLFWLSDFLGRMIGPKEYFLGLSKEYLAAPDRLLIDDKMDNCKEWLKAGGAALLWPAPWNSSRDYSSKMAMQRIKDIHRRIG
jgi:5'(3')-deoxyribonucleotidase